MSGNGKIDRPRSGACSPRSSGSSRSRKFGNQSGMPVRKRRGYRSKSFTRWRSRWPRASWWGVFDVPRACEAQSSRDAGDTIQRALPLGEVRRGAEIEAGAEIGRHGCLLTATGGREAPEFNNAERSWPWLAGTDKDRMLEHKAAIVPPPREMGMPVLRANVFWGGRSEIKPSEISTIRLPGLDGRNGRADHAAPSGEKSSLRAGRATLNPSWKRWLGRFSHHLAGIWVYIVLWQGAHAIFSRILRHLGHFALIIYTRILSGNFRAPFHSPRWPASRFWGICSALFRWRSFS